MDKKIWDNIVEEVTNAIKARKYENDFEKAKAFFWQLGHTVAEKGGGLKLPSDYEKIDKVFKDAFKSGHNVVIQLRELKKK